MSFPLLALLFLTLTLWPRLRTRPAIVLVALGVVQGGGLASLPPLLGMAALSHQPTLLG